MNATMAEVPNLWVGKKEFISMVTFEVILLKDETVLVPFLDMIIHLSF